MLVAATDEAFLALIDGRPAGPLPVAPDLESPANLVMLRELAISIRPAFTPAAWLVVEHEAIVGLISLIAAPQAGSIAIGYGVAPSRRGAGVMRRAVGELLTLMANDPRVTTVTAATSPGNLPSQRVLEANGFRNTGRRIDPEDGEVICWRADLPRQQPADAD